jgi:hypothetical protein
LLPANASAFAYESSVSIEGTKGEVVSEEAVFHVEREPVIRILTTSFSYL